MGRSSVVFEYGVKRVGDGTLCARASQVHVAMSLDARRAVPIPDRYRQAFTGSAN